MSDSEDEYLVFSDNDDENDESDESNANAEEQDPSLSESESDEESVAVAVPVGPTFLSASHFRSRRYEIEHYGNSTDSVSYGMSNFQYSLRYQGENNNKVSLKTDRYWWNPLSKVPYHSDLLPQ